MKAKLKSGKRSKSKAQSGTEAAKRSTMSVGKRTGGLTVLILAVNIVAPLILVVAVLYLGQYRTSLINAEIETLRTQAELFAGVIAEGSVQSVETRSSGFVPTHAKEHVLIPELSRRMVRRLSENTRSRIRLFQANGEMIADSHQLLTDDGYIQITDLTPAPDYSSLNKALRMLMSSAIEMIPNSADLAMYPHSDTRRINAYPDAITALDGKINGTPWRSENDAIFLTAAAPIRHGAQIVGVVYLEHESQEIERAMNKVRFDVLTVFIGTLSLTIFLSIYLAGLIGRPLKKLAHAAEQIRLGQGRQIDIPDLSHRRDEIGELSMALRDMTEALARRMDSIEAFAADVAHELKNPLTSLRSAVETAGKITNEEDRKKMMDIIHHDVRRLDRLITDISRASRLDSELSRDEFDDIDIVALLREITSAMQTQISREDDDRISSIKLDLEINPLLTRASKQTLIKGSQTRLVQVFENLIVNAVSFSPQNGTVQITIDPVLYDPRRLEINITDEGPGIPENKLDTIFERFYSERPKYEAYGNHSGLGLAIARQIIEAHHGTIIASNIGADKQPDGARFTLIVSLS